MLQDRLAATLATLQEQRTAILVAALAAEDEDDVDGGSSVERFPFSQDRQLASVVQGALPSWTRACSETPRCAHHFRCLTAVATLPASTPA